MYSGQMKICVFCNGEEKVSEESVINGATLSCLKKLTKTLTVDGTKVEGLNSGLQ